MNLHMSKVYMTQARATPWPEWRSTLVKWARSRLHAHIAGKDIKAECQFDLFDETKPNYDKQQD
jgi:hypothetical protein